MKKNELEMRKKARELEEKEKNWELDMARKMDTEKKKMEEQMSKNQEQAIDTRMKEIQEENRKKELEMMKQQEQITELIPKIGNTTYNNQYNIVLNAFGKENTSYIDSTIVSQLIKNGPIKSIPRLLKHIHFNPKHPENHNIKIPNRKEKFAIVYSNGRWEIRVKKEVIGDMVDTAYNIIDCHYDEVKNTLEFSRKDRFNNYQSSYDKDNKTRQKIETDVELVILNEKETLKLIT